MTAHHGPIEAPALASSVATSPTPRTAQLAIGLGVAIAILVGAWGVTGRSGLQDIGRGGINESLLPKVGEAAPDFTTDDLLGRPVRLSDFRGEPVWLMFWGSWCPPCRAELPDVQRAYEQLAPEGVRLLGVGIRETPMASAQYALQNGATFDILSDWERGETDAGKAYPLFNVPTHIFIDAEGIVRSLVLSDMDETTALREGRALLTPAPDAP